MKWVFIAGLLVMVPLLAGLLRSQPKYLVHAAFAMGALPFFVVPSLYVAPISWAGWPGPVKGLEVSLIDALAVAILLATRAQARTPTSLKAIFCFIGLALVISTIAGFQAMPAIFYIWQLLRTILLFLAAFRLCSAVPKAPLAILSGAGIGLIYEAIYAAYQYSHGDPRPGGNLGHSNFLGLASSMVTFPALALALAGRRAILWSIIVLAGLVLAVVGGSRATLGLYGIGSMLTIFLSVRHRRTGRKMAAAVSAVLLLLIASPFMYSAIERRSDADKASSNEERSSMKLAASMMIADHPLGVGGDQYVLIANTGGYSARAGVPWSTANRSAPVHSTYYLITAEFGFLGLVSFLALLTTFVLMGFRMLGRPWGDETSELVPGLVASMIIVCIHIGFEWVFMHFVLHYLFALTTGILVACSIRSRTARTLRKPASITSPALAASTA